MKLSELIRRLQKLRELRGDVYVYRCEGNIDDMPMFQISSTYRDFRKKYLEQEYYETLVYEDMDSEQSWRELELPVTERESL